MEKSRSGKLALRDLPKKNKIPTNLSDAIWAFVSILWIVPIAVLLVLLYWR